MTTSAPTRAPLDQIRDLTALVVKIRQQLPAKPVRATATPPGGTLVGRHEYESANHEPGQATTAVGRQHVADPWDRGLADTGTRILTRFAVERALAERRAEKPLLFHELVDKYGFDPSPTEHGGEGEN